MVIAPHNQMCRGDSGGRCGVPTQQFALDLCRAKTLNPFFVAWGGRAVDPCLNLNFSEPTH